MTQPDLREWNSFANLIVSGDDYQILIGFLERSLGDQDVRNRSLDGFHLHRGQGRSQLLAELLQMLKEAPEIRRKLRERS